jgi:thiol-disulfide isomerase/thioredoxin
LFENSKTLNKGIIRDLVLSQGISRYYFSNNLLPTSDEWSQLNNLIENKWILNYLKDYGSEKTSVAQEKINPNQQELNSNFEEVKAKYIDKYKGKIVYIDFYATWCGPCRQEIPYAKQLHAEFKNEEVVFLNLCAKSKQEDWGNFKRQYELEGENYLLNNEEFYLLSDIYKVQGFPTYILIDKEGNVVDYNALRPSTKKSLYDKINELL